MLASLLRKRSPTSTRRSRSARRECRREASRHETWKSKIFEGTIREYWVYVPAQYDGSTPAAVMVFQDGHAYVNEKGWFRVPIVFDNLIAKARCP
jgi:enterochelin esterase family protein